MMSVEEAKRLLSYKKVGVLPKNESENSLVLYVFRHGQSEDNANFIFSGWRESKLTEIGIKQVEVLAEKLKSKKIDFLISSPQVRAIETMKIVISKNKLAQRLEIHLDDRIKERSYTKRAQNGESLEDVIKRVTSFCDDLVKQMKESGMNVAVSCHGNSMRGFRKYFEGLSIEQTCEVETPLGQDYASYVVE